MFKKTILTVVVGSALLSLTGCASFKPADMPKSSPYTPASAAKKVNEMPAQFDQDTPVDAEGQSSITLIAPTAIPDSLANRKVVWQFDENMDLRGLSTLLASQMSIPVIVGSSSNSSTPTTSSSSSATSSASNDSFYLPYYKGSVGNLLKIVSNTTDMWIVWKDGALTFSPKERISIVAPQNEEVVKQLETAVKGYGVEGVTVSKHAGVLSMEVKPSQYRQLKVMLERFISNTAIVNMQVAVVNVTLDQNVKQGIDWDSLQVASSGRGANVNSLFDLNAKIPGSSTADSTSSSSTTTNTVTDLARKITGAVASGSSLKGVIIGNHFNFSGMFNYLQTYGDAETTQNIMLRGLTGNKAKFKSITNIPYVSKVNATTTGTTSTSVTGSTETAKAEDGVTVEVLPNYNADTNVIAVDMSLSVKSVLGMIDLSAGNQIGKLTQPSEAAREMGSYFEVRPGQTVVVGGLTYDSVSNNKAAPIPLANTRAESQALTTKRQSMFIVIKPYVVRMGKLKEEVSRVEELQLAKPAASSVIPVKVVDEGTSPSTATKSKKKIVRKSNAKKLD